MVTHSCTAEIETRLQKGWFLLNKRTANNPLYASLAAALRLLFQILDARMAKVE